MIIFKCLNAAAVIPTRGTEGSAGFDLYYSGLSVELAAGEYGIFDTGIQMSMSPNLVGNIRPRSGLAVKYGIDTMAGTIDSDYRGEIKVVLINHGKRSICLRQGERIAQLVVSPFCCDVQEYTVEKFDETDRGIGGFGSTGR